MRLVLRLGGADFLQFLFSIVTASFYQRFKDLAAWV